MVANTRNIEIDSSLAVEAEKNFNKIGLSLVDGINALLRQAIEREVYIRLFDRMREDVIKSGDFLTDEEINAEINSARMDRRAGN
jgi:antitoxin component of RelBE/YafQ-DinJ toxin-antitoxin module